MKCPCHQAEFDPNKSGQVVNGPAVNPLGKVKVAVKGAWVIEA
jgi:Rieske Fe-S protein